MLGASRETEFCKMFIGLQWRHITTMFFVIGSWEYTVYFFLHAGVSETASARCCLGGCTPTPWMDISVCIAIKPWFWSFHFYCVKFAACLMLPT
jgi:hypothetical protein